MTEESGDPGNGIDLGGHPKGTLAIVGLYGLFFVIGWLVLYYLVFVPRGTMGH